MDILKGIKGRLHVTGRRAHGVGREERVDGGQVRASRGGEPTKAAHQTLVGFLPTELGRGGIVGRRSRDGVDRKTGPPWGSNGILVAVLQTKTFDQVAGEARLVEMDVNVVGGNTPQEVDAEEPLHRTHEIDRDLCSKKALELRLDLVRGGEVDEIIDVEADDEGNLRRSVGGV